MNYPNILFTREKNRVIPLDEDEEQKIENRDLELGSDQEKEQHSSQTSAVPQRSVVYDATTQDTPELSAGDFPVMQIKGMGRETGHDGFKCNDGWMGLLFLLHVFAIVYLAVEKGSWLWYSSHHWLTFVYSKDIELEREKSFLLVEMLMLSSLTTVPLALLLIKLLMKYPLVVMRKMLIGSIIMLLTTGFGFLILGSALGFIFCTAMGLGIFCYYRAMEHHLEFSATNVKVAAMGVAKYSHLLRYALMMVICQALWVLIWNIAAISVSGLEEKRQIRQQGRNYDVDMCIEGLKNDEIICTCVDESNPISFPYSEVEGECNESNGHFNFGIFFLLAISLYWGSTVILNVIHCVVSGTVARWWFSENEEKPNSREPMLAWRRAMTTSFGSICLGSLLVAITKSVQDALWALRKGDNHAITCCVNCLLSALEKVVEIFNRYAFCYVAIYGKDFKTAGKEVYYLFKRMGWIAIVNDDLVARTMNMICLINGLVQGLAVFTYTSYYNLPVGWSNMMIWAVTLSGYLICWTILNIVSCAVTTVFVCFAEDPGVFQASNPDIYMEMVRAWATCHGNEMRSAGYVL